MVEFVTFRSKNSRTRHMVAQEAPAAANWYRTRLFVVPQLHSSVLPLLTSSAWPKSSMAFAGHDTTELKAKYRDAMCINPKLIIQTCAKHRKQHTSSARATPRQGPAGRRLLKRRLLMNFPKRNKQTTVQSLNARLSQPCPGRRTRNTTHRACTPVNRSREAQDAVHATPHAERAQG